MTAALSANSQTCYRSWTAMGTQFGLFLRGDDELHLDAVAVTIAEELTRLDELLSRFDWRSEIARINRLAFASPARVDYELFALLEYCENARIVTGGYFDLCAASGHRGDIASLHLDAQQRTVQFASADVFIDLGAVGKGYALDCGAEIMQRFGVHSGLLQGGTSSVLAIGDDAWPMAVRHPLRPDVIVERLALRNCGFSCSAARHPDQSQSDIVDPLTAQPLAGDDACVVIAPNATEAEILSTALLAMGCENAAAFLRERARPDVRVGWFTSETGIRWIEAGAGAE